MLSCTPTASCSFENSLCSWSLESVGDELLNFVRVTPQQIATIGSTLINSDKTTNSKYGHLIWAGGKYQGALKNRLKIYSETVLARDFSTCFSFHYILINETAVLEVNRQMYATALKKNEFTASGSNQTNWNRVLLPFEASSLNFEIFIEGSIKSSEAEIAVDVRA